MTQKIDPEELFKIMIDYYEEKSPFNKLLGIKIDELSLEKPVVSFEMKDELVGNTHMAILHGGVIATVLDFTGGVVAHLSVIEKMQDALPEEIGKRLFQVGTIDMRVDYIRPGRGHSFKATGEMLRIGNKVAVTRSVLHNEEGVLIAAATGTYLVG